MSAMDLRQLECFVAVGEELSFAQAGKRLLFTTSNVSQHVRQLERELGVVLLDRTTRRVSLTPAGASLLPRARRALSAVENLREAAQQARDGEVGSVTGLFCAGAADIASLLRDEVNRTSRDVTIDFNASATTALFQALKRGAVSLGIARCSAAGLDSLLLTCHPRSMVVLPDHHPLAARESLSVNDLTDYDVVLVDRQTNPRAHDEIVDFFRANRVEPRYHPYPTLTVEGVIELVAMGHGAAMMTEFDTKRYPRRGTVVVPLLGPVLTVEHHLLWRENDNSPIIPAVVATAERLRGVFASI